MDNATDTDTFDANAYYHGPKFDLVVDAKLRKQWAAADYLVFRFHEIAGMPSYHRDAREVTVRATYRDRFDGPQTAREWTTRGRVGTGYKQATRLVSSDLGCESHAYSDEPGNRHVPPSGSAWACYMVDTARAVVESLPNGAKIKVVVAMDWKTCGYHVTAGLHEDVLMLVCEWTDKRGRGHRRDLILDTQTSPHNSARFGVSL